MLFFIEKIVINRLKPIADSAAAKFKIKKAYIKPLIWDIDIEAKIKLRLRPKSIISIYTIKNKRFFWPKPRLTSPIKNK